MKKTINIIDTNVLLHDPQALFNFPEQLVVIPISVIEELDTFKRNQDELGKNARYVTKQIDLLREQSEKTGDISSSSEDRNIETYGIELYNKGRLVIELNHIGLLKELDQSKTDNRILSVAKHYNTKFKNHTVCLVTKDSNLRIKSDAYGVKAIDYQDDMIQSVDESYSGLKKIELSSDNFLKLKDVKSLVKLSDIKINEKLFENQYILLINESNKSQHKLFKHVTQNEQSCLVKLITPENSLWGLTAKNLEQQCAIDALLDPNISLVTLSGKAGTGKTLISIAAALFQSLDEATYKKTLIARPIFALGKDIGFLPGSVQEKLDPWMQPIFDNLEFLMNMGNDKNSRTNNRWKELIEQGMIQVEALTYIRGRSIPNQFFIIDESQNLTKHEIKTILSRAGMGTKIVLTGDPEQIDNPYVDQLSNGLSIAIETFKDDPIAAHITLVKGERSPLAEKAVKLIK